MTQRNTQKDLSNKALLKEQMHSQFKLAALGAVLMCASSAPFLTGMDTIWDLRAAVTPEQIATHTSYAASLKSCKNSTLPGKDAAILDCTTKRTKQNVIEDNPAFKPAMALSIGGFAGMAGGLLWSVASAGAAFDVRRKYRGHTPA